MKKTVYGTYDGIRGFYKSIDEDLRRMGGIRITGEEAIYAFYEKEDGDCRLVGLVWLHVDELNNMETEEFHKNITDQLQKMYVFGKV